MAMYYNRQYNGRVIRVVCEISNTYEMFRILKMAKQLSGAKISLSEKRETFRIQIRREVINDILQTRRRILEQQSPESLTTFTSEERDSIIQQATLQFTGQPSAEWFFQIEKLLGCISNFQGNFESLLKTSILYNLSQLFTSNYDAVSWRHRAAILISNIVSQNKTPGLVSRLLSYDFLKEFPRIFSMYQTSMTAEQCQDYIYLLSNIAGDNMTARNAVVTAGTVAIVKELLDKVVDMNMLELLLWFVSNLVKNDDEEATVKLSYNLISPFLPALDKFIMLDQPNILKSVLYSIFFLTDGKAYKIANIFHSANIKVRLVELLTAEDKVVRVLALKIIGCFCGSQSNKHFVTEFVQLGLFDQLAKSLGTFNYIRREKKEFIWLLNNLLRNSNQELDFFIRHPLFAFAYEWLHKSQEESLRTEALTIFLAVFSFASWCQLDYVFKSRPETLGMIVACLEQAQTASYRLITRSLKCFTVLIPSYNEIYTPHQNNKIIFELQRQYNFQSRFMQLVDHKNEKISNEAAQLFNIYGQSSVDFI